jgi:DNA gyrase/topoisomerase IV subunit A
LSPYFRGYRGDIDIKVKVPKKTSAAPAVLSSATDTPKSSATDEDHNSDAEEDAIPEFYKGRGFVTRGKYEILKEYSASRTMDVKVTEIPISMSVKAYLEFIDQLIDEGKAKDKRDNSSSVDETICFEIYNLNSNLATYEGLKLEGGFPLSNLVMIDNDGIPTCFESVEAILAKYVVQMINMYQVYKDHIINSLEAKLVDIKMEMAIIKAYLDGKLIIDKKTTDEQINKQLKDLKLSQKVFDDNNITLRKLSADRVKLLQGRIDKIEEELELIKSKTPEALWTERLVAFKNEFIRRKVYAVPYEDALVVEDSSNMIVDGEVSFKKAMIVCNYD